jgi:anti-anti-sigma regulatory factor
MIDAIAHNPLTNEVILSIIENKNWSKSTERLMTLQDKINLYMEFIVDGHLANHLKHKKIDPKKQNIYIEISFLHQIDSEIQNFLHAISEAIKQYNIQIKIVEPNKAGHN